MTTFAENLVIQEEDRLAFEDVLRKFMVNELKLAPKSVKIHSVIPQHRIVNINVHVYNPNNDFYFRLGYFDETSSIKEIVVARIGFKKPRNGSGTKLFKELCKFGKDFGYTFLSIECPNKDCKQFMLKLDFPSDQYRIGVQELLLSIENKIKSDSVKKSL